MKSRRLALLVVLLCAVAFWIITSDTLSENFGSSVQGLSEPMAEDVNLEYQSASYKIGEPDNQMLGGIGFEENEVRFRTEGIPMWMAISGFVFGITIIGLLIACLTNMKKKYQEKNVEAS